MAKDAYWVRLTKADGEQTLWCINTGAKRAKAVYAREQAKAAPGDIVEWGKGNAE